MSGSAVKCDFSKLVRVLNKYKGIDNVRVLRGIGQMIVTQTLERFDTQTSPEGKPWKKTARGGNILRDEGNLYNSIHYLITGKNSVAVGTNLEYAAIHQFGGVIKPDKHAYLTFFVPGVGFRRTKKVVMPARPYLGVNEGDKREIRQFIQSFFAGFAK